MKQLIFAFILTFGTLHLSLGQNADLLEGAWQLNQERSQVTYSGVHFLHRWSGTNQSIVGLIKIQNDQVTTIAISAKVIDFDSGNENRDAHALELLEVFDHPNVRFFADKTIRQGNDIVLEGTLQFRGVALPLAPKLQLETSASTLRIYGDFNIQPSLFDMPLPSFMLKEIDDALTIAIDLYFDY